MYPTDRRYSKEHEWLTDGDEAQLGITDFAQNELGDIVYVELPEAGTEFQMKGVKAPAAACWIVKWNHVPSRSARVFTPAVGSGSWKTRTATAG